MMLFVPWQDSLRTGIDIVDRQHKGLVDLINELAPLLAHTGRERLKDIAPIYSRLMDYAASHFRTEEELMAEFGVDSRVLDHHRQTHAGFVAHVSGMAQDFMAGEGVTGIQLLSFLAGWLVLHILGEDQTMARQIAAIQAGARPDRAYEAAQGARLEPSKEALTQTMVACYTTMSEQNRELVLMRDHLEELVQARTSDLTAMAAELRQARDAAEAASQAKSRFLGMVSHELRTPMNAIVGFAEVLRGAGLPARQDALAARVLTASRQLAELIDGLIEYSRHEASKAAPFELRAVLTEACQAPFAAANAKGLKVALEMSPGLPACLLGDAGRIALVVRQFAANAVKFTAQGGLRVRAEPLGEEALDGRVALRLSVIDTGPGIPADKLEGLFEAFHQLDDSPTRHFGGVGLGLALTRQAARILGGEVGVLSEPGQGSQFWFDLSLLPAQGVAEVGPSEPASPGAEAKAPETVAVRVAPELLARLERLLSEDDTRANDLLVEAEAALRQVLGERFDALAAQVAAFEYDHALHTLRGHN